MYITLNAEIHGWDLSSPNAQKAIQNAKIEMEKSKTMVRAELDKFLLPNGNFDGAKMQSAWFPEVKADVFLSHSHSDMDLTLFVASILEGFGLKVFIDSAVWGHANDLIKKIDNELCPNGNGTYNYEKRNYSTAHVHMMLSVALNKMIDKTECLLFLNTPNSVTTKNIVQNKTESPWIYSEIASSKLIGRREPQRRNVKTFAKGNKIEVIGMILEGIEHELDLSEFIKFNNADFINWNELTNDVDHALDILYKYLFQRENNLL